MFRMVPSHKNWGVGMCLIAFIVCRAHAVCAESVGSPASILKRGQWAMGASGGTLFSRGMQGGADASVYSIGHFRGYGLTNWLSVYGKIGAAFVSIDDSSIVKVKDSSVTNQFGFNLLTSAQIKAKLVEFTKMGVEWDGSVQYVDIRARHRGRNATRWHEWDFATSVAKAFGKVKPYVGVKVSVLDVFFRVHQNDQVIKQGTYKADGIVGPFLGTDIYFGEQEDIVLNVESSYINGFDINAALAYTF